MVLNMFIFIGHFMGFVVHPDFFPGRKGRCFFSAGPELISRLTFFQTIGYGHNTYKKV
jgi:hypothetical protein